MTEPPIDEGNIDEEGNEEEEELPDNTTNRDDILNSQPKDYNEWIAYINNLDINVPDIPDIDFNDDQEIFSHIPIVIDACKCIYNTLNYRFESYANVSNELYSTYKTSFEAIESKYQALIDEINEDQLMTTDEKEEQLKELNEKKGDEIQELNTDYLNKSFILAKEMKSLKDQTKNETGFIGDVYIEGKLNNHDVSEYVLKEQLDTKADKEHGHDFNVIQDTLTLNVNNVSITDNLTEKYALKDELENIRASTEEELDKKADKEHGHDFNVKQDTLTLNVNNVSIADNLTEKYALKEHTHTKEEITDLEDLNNTYALKDHTHSNYAAKEEVENIRARTEEELDKKADINHNHDDRYYTETECNNKFALKDEVENIRASTEEELDKKADINHTHNNYANSSHNHDDRYYTETECNNKYALKEHTHDDKYALKDHTHSDIQDLIAAYEKRIVFLELALQIANKYEVMWEDNGTQYINESDVFDIIVGYYFTFFKLKDRFIGTKVFLTINEEEYPGENNYSIKYVNYNYGNSDPQTFGSNHSLALRGDKKYCKFECLYENIYPGDIPLFMNVSFTYGSMSKNYTLSIYQNAYPYDYYDKFFNL